MNRPGRKPGRFSFRHRHHAARRGGLEANTIMRMSTRPDEESSARRAALAGAAAGLALAGALLLPALLAGSAPARGDLADFFWPMKAYTAERWLAEGRPPLWNSLSACGEPWLAQLQSGALYPGDLPFLIGWREGAFLAIALHLALAAGGAAFFLWELGASRPGAVLAGALYAGGGTYLSLVPVYNNASTAAWIPWVFACAWRVAAGRSRGAGLGVAVAGAFLAGEPSLAAAACAAAFAVALFAGADGERGVPSGARARLAGRLALPLLLGVAMAAAALVPFAAYVASSERRTSVTREEALARAVGPSDVADLVAGPRSEATRAESPGRGAYLVTLAFGPLPLLLAAGAGAGLPGRRKLLASLGAVAAAAVLLSLGRAGGLAPLLFDAGLLRGLRYPARWFVFAHLVLALAAGAGLDGWLWGRFGSGGAGQPDAEAEGDEAREGARRRRTARFVLAAGLVLLGALGALALFHRAARESRDPFAAAIGAGAAAAGAALLALSRLGTAEGRRSAAVFVALLAVAPLPFLAREPLEAAPASAVRAAPAALGATTGPEAGRVFAPAAQDRSLALRWRYADGDAWGPAAVARASEALAGYANLFHGVATTGSASPLGNPRIERLAGAALAGGDAGRILALLNVRQVLSPFPPSFPGLRHVRTANGVGRWNVPVAFGRAFFPEAARIASDDEAFASLRTPGYDPGALALVAADPKAGPLPRGRTAGSWAAARFLVDEPERVEMATSASAPSLLVLTRSWDAGWEARLDGTPVPLRRAQLALLAVDVPEGEHRLELRYRPLSFRVGLGISAAGLVGLLALALASPAGRRRA